MSPGDLKKIGGGVARLSLGPEERDCSTVTRAGPPGPARPLLPAASSGPARPAPRGLHELQAAERALADLQHHAVEALGRHVEHTWRHDLTVESDGPGAEHAPRL